MICCFRCDNTLSSHFRALVEWTWSEMTRLGYGLAMTTIFHSGGSQSSQRELIFHLVFFSSLCFWFLNSPFVIQLSISIEVLAVIVR